MTSTWRITLRCGHCYHLPTGVPDLRTPYICGACDNALRSVVLAARVDPDSETTS